MKIEPKDKNEAGVKWPVILMSGFVIVFVFIIFIGILLYGFGINNGLIRNTAKVIPFPAAFWGDDMVRLEELDEKLVAAKNFYENQDFGELGIRIDFSTEEGKKRLKIKERKILNKLIEDQIIESEANKRGIILTKEAISKEVDEKLRQYGDENQLKENMAKLYGWSVDDFKKNIVKPDLYEEKLSEDIRKKYPDNIKAKDKINEALAELTGRNEFERVIEKYSEGESAENKGNLGWMSAEQMLPEISSVVFAMEKGKRSEIIESRLGYHIIQINDKKTEDGVEKVELSQIFVRTYGLAEWLEDYEKKLKIIIPLKDFHWNKEKSSVEFQSEILRNFEENLSKNSPDDLSVIF